MRKTHAKPDRATLCAQFWALPSDEALVNRPTAGAVAGLGAKSMELLAMRGGGPAYVIIGRQAMYRRGDVIAWLAKAGRKVTSTAERGAKAAEAA
jgi:hypothetical protein